MFRWGKTLGTAPSFGAPDTECSEAALSPSVRSQYAVINIIHSA